MSDVPSAEFENLVQLFKAQRSAAPGEGGVEDMRTAYDMLGQMLPPVPDVPFSDGEVGGVPARRFDPPDASRDAIVLYLHGGGYCIGSRNSHSPLCASLAMAARVPVVLAEYRLAPEAPFPAGLEDAQSSYEALSKDVARVVVAGDSAGGGLALGLCLSLREASRSMPAGLVLISPWCDATSLGNVSAEAMDVDFLRPETLEWFADRLAPKADLSDPRCSPLLADLTGLPPLLIQAGEHEILVDQAIHLAANAKDAGVDVTLEIEPGMFHHWPVFAGALPEAGEAIARAARFIQDKTR